MNIADLNCIYNFKGYDIDTNEYCKPVNESTTAEGAGEARVIKPKDGQGRRQISILNKEKTKYFIDISSAFYDIKTLILSNLEMQVRIFLTSPEKYFLTETKNIRPIFKIHDAKLVMEYLLLKQNLLTSIEKRLQRSALQVPFL